MSKSGKKAGEGGTRFCSIMLIRMGLTLLQRRFFDVFGYFHPHLFEGNRGAASGRYSYAFSIVRFSRLISGIRRWTEVHLIDGVADI